MKKIMFAMLMVIAMVVGASASNSKFKESGSAMYSVNENVITYIYKNVHTENLVEGDTMNLLEANAKSQLCNDSTLGTLIRNGTTVVYIYLNKDVSDGAIFNISSCN